MLNTLVLSTYLDVRARLSISNLRLPSVRKDVHLVLFNRLGSLPRNSVVGLTDSLDMTIVVGWDVKPQIKQTHKFSCESCNFHIESLIYNIQLEMSFK